MDEKTPGFYKRKTLPPFRADPKKERFLPDTPERIGPYPIEILLDQGGMSLLYLGTHPETEAPITVKVLSPKFLEHPEMTSRFLKEAEIIALADHPNIVKLYGYGEWENGLYIAMEFIQGVSLRKYMHQHSLSLKRAIEMVLEIAYALCHLHTHGVIHRDLKPENILLDEKGHIKVIDFGIAQLVNPLEIDKRQEEIARNRLVGTPIYMSPEQRKSPESVSYPSDIYSLGIIAYELILGKLQGGQIHISMTPKGIQKILTRALQPNPEERYLDIVDFISDLSAYLESPDFGLEKKSSDQSAELFERLQTFQSALLPKNPEQIGLIIHRPLGLSGIFMDWDEKKRELLFGKSENNESDGFLRTLYFKGLLDGILPLADSKEALATLLSAKLEQTNSPSCSFGYLTLENDLASYLSCGAGILWHITEEKIFQRGFFNPPLGKTTLSPYKPETFPVQKGDKLVICPPLTAEHPFDEKEFLELLTQHKNLSPKPLAELIYRKAKALRIPEFEKHSFLVFILPV